MLAGDRVWLLPPLSETRRNEAFACASRSTRPRTLTAFERPSAIRARMSSLPAGDLTDRIGLGRCSLAERRCAPTCPCFPHTHRQAPSSSLSRLTRSTLTSAPSSDSRPRGRPLPPPSSAARAARGQRLVLDQRHHRCDRHPVIRAERRSFRVQPLPVANERNAPSAGSFGLEGSRSQTMSRWPWSTRSAPTRGPVSPELGSRGSVRRPARARTPAGRPTRERARSPAPRARDGRATFVSASKCPQNQPARAPSTSMPGSPCRSRSASPVAFKTRFRTTPAPCVSSCRTPPA